MENETLLLRKQLKQVVIYAENVLPELAKKKQHLMISDTSLNVSKIAYHSYSATTIFLMLQWVLNAAVSLRGS